MPNTETLETRVDQLERERERRALQQQLSTTKKRRDWRKTVGVFADAPLFEEIVRAGAEIRLQERRETACD